MRSRILVCAVTVSVLWATGAGDTRAGSRAKSRSSSRCAKPSSAASSTSATRRTARATGSTSTRSARPTPAAGPAWPCSPCSTPASSPDDPTSIQRGLHYLRSIEPRQTYVVGLQTMVFAEAGRTEDRERIQRNVDWLLAARVMRRRRAPAAGATARRGGSADNSNTQYALLGLHAGHQAGAKIDRDVWESIRDFYIRTQQADGGWVYDPASAAAGTDADHDHRRAVRPAHRRHGAERRPRAAPRRRQRPTTAASTPRTSRSPRPWAGSAATSASSAAIAHLLQPLRHRAGRPAVGPALPRRARLVPRGLRVPRRAPAGRRRLLARSRRGRDGWPVVATSFALLFLSKGRTPVLISKLAHGAGRGLEQQAQRRPPPRRVRQPRAVQEAAAGLADLRRPPRRGLRNRRRAAGDLVARPAAVADRLLQRPRAAALHRRGEGAPQAVRRRGGFLLAEACCGRPEFDDGFRELMTGAVPRHAAASRWPPEHPVWRAHALVPPSEFDAGGHRAWAARRWWSTARRPLAGCWEANQHDEGPRPARVPAGRQHHRLRHRPGAAAAAADARSRSIQDARTRKQVPRGYLKVAQLRHDGDWQPAPRAMRNLMLHLRDKAELDVALQTGDRCGPATRTWSTSSSCTCTAATRFTFYAGGAGEPAGEPGDRRRCCSPTPAAAAGVRRGVPGVRRPAVPGQEAGADPAGDDLYGEELGGGRSRRSAAGRTRPARRATGRVPRHAAVPGRRSR